MNTLLEYTKRLGKILVDIDHAMHSGIIRPSLPITQWIVLKDIYHFTSSSNSVFNDENQN